MNLILLLEALRSRAGLASKMAPTQRPRMTGLFFPSWHYQTVLTRKIQNPCVAPFARRSLGLYRSTEDFSYFTLRRRATQYSPSTSVFGISCTRQMDASQLHNRPADVTRSTVQKAVVAIADSPQFFGQLREKLSMVTGAWFAQKYGGVLWCAMEKWLIQRLQGLYRCRCFEGR